MQVNDLGQGLLTRYELKARHQEEHQTGELLITGTGQLLDSPINAELTMSLTQFELHQISPYLGYGIRSGRLGLDSSIKITDNQIAAKNRVRIEGLKLMLAKLKRRASADLPLSVALNLLKDQDGRIDLKVPIQTKLGKFAVDTSDIVNTALVNAAKQAAFAYVKQHCSRWAPCCSSKTWHRQLPSHVFNPLYLPRAVPTLRRHNKTI